MVRRRLAALPVKAALAAAAIASLQPLLSAAQAGDPVAAMRRYVEVRKSNCAKTWDLFTTASQEQIRANANRRERDREGLPRPFVAGEEACGASPVASPTPGTERLVSQQGKNAVVMVDNVRLISRHRYDVFPAKLIEKVPVSLAQENGEWRVVAKPIPQTERGTSWNPQEFGPVDVQMPRVNPGMIDRYEATAVLPVTRSFMETAIRDPRRWALALPGVKAVQDAEPAGGQPRILLQFEEPGRTLPVRLRPALADENDREASSVIQWQAEEGPASPVHFRGSWTVRPHRDGSSRITLVFYLDLKQWPGGYAQRHFAAERLAQAVLALEKSAR